MLLKFLPHVNAATDVQAADECNQQFARRPRRVLRRPAFVVAKPHNAAISPIGQLHLSIL